MTREAHNSFSKPRANREMSRSSPKRKNLHMVQALTLACMQHTGIQILGMCNDNGTRPLNKIEVPNVQHWWMCAGCADRRAEGGQAVGDQERGHQRSQGPEGHHPRC